MGEEREISFFKSLYYSKDICKMLWWFGAGKDFKLILCMGVKKGFNKEVIFYDKYF